MFELGVGYSVILHSRLPLPKPSSDFLHSFDAVTVLRDTSLWGVFQDDPAAYVRVLRRPMSVFGPLSNLIEAGLNELSDTSDLTLRGLR